MTDLASPAPAQVLTVHDGDVIVLKSIWGDPEEAQGMVGGFLDRIREAGLKNVMVACVDDLEQVALFDEEQMRHHGWVRCA